MSLAAEILSVVACPRCRGQLRLTKEEVLVCLRCRVCYPVENGMPQLSHDDAMPLNTEGKIVPQKSTAIFTISSAPLKGETFRLLPGMCKAIGRRMDDVNQTLIFNADFTMSLDDHTTDLIRNYLAKKNPKAKKQDKPQHDLGAYDRQPDLILNDPKVSRLHAMIFYDEGGAGILDLVSRNGTYVNGKEIEACYLKSGDEIACGETKIIFTVK